MKKQTCQLFYYFWKACFCSKFFHEKTVFEMTFLKIESDFGSKFFWQKRNLNWKFHNWSDIELIILRLFSFEITFLSRNKNLKMIFFGNQRWRLTVLKKSDSDEKFTFIKSRSELVYFVNATNFSFFCFYWKRMFLKDDFEMKFFD